MDADWSVELGADDPALEFPWASADGTQRYVDLLHHPEALADVPEALQYPELGEFLGHVNAASSPWLTVKCDVWFDGDLGETETSYDATVKFCSYVDLVARDDTARWSFERHESWVKSAARRLDSAIEEHIAGELIVRRCWYRLLDDSKPSDHHSTAAEEDPAAGYYVTLYLFGYGCDQTEARVNWAKGLRRVTDILAALAG